MWWHSPSSGAINPLMAAPLFTCGIPSLAELSHLSLLQSSASAPGSQNDIRSGGPVFVFLFLTRTALFRKCLFLKKEGHLVCTAAPPAMTAIFVGGPLVRP